MADADEEPKAVQVVDHQHYNKLFEKFVDDPDNPTTGYVAYGLYKQEKRNWAIDFRAKNGRRPTQDELDRYEAMWTPGLIDNTKESARQILADFAAFAVNEARPEILQEALRGSVLKDIIVSMFASFLYTLLLIGLAVIIFVSGSDLASIFQSIAKLFSGS